jgi:uncharacterized protein YukE
MGDTQVNPRTDQTAAKDPDTFLTQVGDAIEKLGKAIDDFLEKMANFVNDHLTEAGVLGGAAAGSMFGPLGTIVGGVIGGLTGNELEEKFHNSCGSVVAEWEKQRDFLWSNITSMVGNPLKMSQIASAYRDAAAELGKGANEISTGNGPLKGDGFEGRAFNAYSTVSTQQDAALKGLQDQLIAAAKVMDDNEVSLLKFWNNELWNVLNAIDDIYGVVGDIGNIGNAPTFEAGPMIKLIGKIIGIAGSILKDWGTYWIDLNVASAGNWDGLNSGFGSKGMPDGKWPVMGDISTGAMNGGW